MEETVAISDPFEGSQTLQVTALGRSKAAHEFLVLHYFGVDSAMHWNVLTSEVHYTVPPQNASCVVDRLNDLDLEPFDGRQNGKIHGLLRHPDV